MNYVFYLLESNVMDIWLLERDLLLVEIDFWGIFCLIKNLGFLGLGNLELLFNMIVIRDMFGLFFGCCWIYNKFMWIDFCIWDVEFEFFVIDGSIMFNAAFFLNSIYV